MAHCWAHARRKLVEASAESPRVSAWLLGQIQAMYGIERKLREKKGGSALRAAVRASQTSMVLERVFKAMTLLRARCLSGGALAKALDYSLERREGLSRFLGDGRIEIDSNLVENAIRPCAIGRRNWLFIGHPEAGDRAAIFYSIMASCRLHGVNAYDYLCDVLRRAATSTRGDGQRGRVVHTGRVGEGEADSGPVSFRTLGAPQSGEDAEHHCPSLSLRYSSKHIPQSG